MRDEAMTQSRLDLPSNFPGDWDAPSFSDGEIPALVMLEGERIISSQRALVMGGIRSIADAMQVKRGVACFRLGTIFETNRRVILDALRRERGSHRE